MSLSGTKLGTDTSKRTARCSEEWTVYWKRQRKTRSFITQAGGHEQPPGKLKSVSKRKGSLGGSSSTAIRERHAGWTGHRLRLGGGRGEGVLSSAEDTRERDQRKTTSGSEITVYESKVNSDAFLNAKSWGFPRKFFKKRSYLKEGWCF